MKTAIWIAVVLSAGFAWAQSDQAARSDQPSGQVTVRGCVTMVNGDYALTKPDPGNTYELQKAEKIKLRSYLGQRVEITGTKSRTLSTSEDAINAGGNASPVTITIQSIKTISKECQD
jgi:hypothetical protein